MISHHGDVGKGRFARIDRASPCCSKMDVAGSLVENPARNGSGAGLKEKSREAGVNSSSPAHTPEIEIDASRLDSDSSDDDSGEEWETTSLYEDALQFIGDEQLRDGSMYIYFIGN